MSTLEWDVAGTHGRVAVREWNGSAPTWLCLVAHGYGEHMGRYERLAAELVADGAVVVGPDHTGHGESDGERVLVESYDDVVADLHAVARRTLADHPGLPVVLLGHSMGGMIAARYVQLHARVVDVLVLSSPVLGRWAPVTDLLGLPEIPDGPLDTSTLSRDPEVGAAYEADPLVWHGPFKRPTIAAMARTMKDITDGPDLGSLPTLWIHGDADTLVPIDGTRVGIPELGASALTERTYPGGRHELFNETNRDEVVADVRAFVRENLPAG
ncbi:lysophospholipase [Marmoricola endophyticus]|uniref:Lysophospholipase n=1 Tax=Marmoricola endophyticus TaxID=2040280 RepID=A0A917BEC8_9ACTN|nr:alpha/beta hydrolase [Marmoricola endophyticus]GGF39522.1 lysophospholipase [Marmoricola endophyticus]